MVRICMLLIVWCNCLAAVRAQEDSLQHTRWVTRALSVGTGPANVLDTYLTPLEYKGMGVRWMFENLRMTRLMQGNVSVQHMLQMSASYTHNPAQTAHMYAGLLNYSCALHYQFKVGEKLKLLAGPSLDLNVGGIWNRRNSNNPAQAKAYGGLGVSGMAIYRFRLLRYPFLARYQVGLPVAGLLFSPEYGESYYEIFSLHEGGRNVVFTSLHNQPSLRQMLTMDFPLGRTTWRVGYVCDLQQAEVHHLKWHSWSHDFTIGFVRDIYLMKRSSAKAPFRRHSFPF